MARGIFRPVRRIRFDREISSTNQVVARPDYPGAMPAGAGPVGVAPVNDPQSFPLPPVNDGSFGRKADRAILAFCTQPIARRRLDTDNAWCYLSR